jgi:hypothetical protein
VLLSRRWRAKRPVKKGRKKPALRLPTFAMHLNDYYPRQAIVTLVTGMFFFYPNSIQVRGAPQCLCCLTGRHGQLPCVRRECRM